MFSSLPTAMARINSPSPVSQEPALQDAFAKARDAIGRENAEAAVHSLAAAFGGNQGAFHDVFLKLLDSASSQMRQQLIAEACRQLQDFARDALHKGKTILDLALDLAVRHRDPEFAEYLLRQGAHPEPASLAGAAGGMQAWATRWRLKNLFYADRGRSSQRSERLSSSSECLHAGAGHEKWTPLDHALSKGCYKEADALLRKEVDGQRMLFLDPDSALWRKAMAEERHDLLRAMLMLRLDVVRRLAKDKQKVGRWLQKLHKDSGLSAALKEFPYQPAKWGAPKKLNGKARFHSTANLIVCRHLATYQQEVQARDSKIKFDYRKFGSVEEITFHVQPDIENTYKALLAQASAAHLIDNSKFGQFLAGQFREMEGEDNPATRLMLVESTNHAMNLGLMIKEKDGKTSYVVKFFDPADTTTGMRSKAGSVQTFEKQTIQDYLSDKACRVYYPEAKGLSMIFARPKEGEGTGTSAVPGFAAGRRLTTCIDSEEVDATAVWHFMRCGFAANLMDLQGHLATLPEVQRIKVLAGKDAKGTPALWAGMYEGQAEAIKAYGELLRQAEPLSEQKLIELLAGKDEDGFPALYVGMRKGLAEAVKAYGELLRQAKPLPEQKLTELLAGESKGGIPALLTGMYEGHAEAVKAYGEAVKLLPLEKQADLLLIKVSTGPHAGKGGFDIAVEEGQFGAADAQLQLLVQLALRLSEGKRAGLLKEVQGYTVLLKETGTHEVPEFRQMRDTLSKLETGLRNNQAMRESRRDRE